MAMAMEDIVERSYLHYGVQWFHSLYNSKKFSLLYDPQNETLRKFKSFIDNWNIPHEHFANQTKDRSSAMQPVKADQVERPSRFKKIIEEGLAHQGNRERHYVVQKYLVESSETNFIISEVPVWSDGGEFKGHIDLIEITPHHNPCIWLWDYKPWSSSNEQHHVTGQLMMYQTLMSQLLDVPFNVFGLGYFDNIQETTIW